jgi:hypothetical protein
MKRAPLLLLALLACAARSAAEGKANALGLDGLGLLRYPLDLSNLRVEVEYQRSLGAMGLSASAFYSLTAPDWGEVIGYAVGASAGPIWYLGKGGGIEGPWLRTRLVAAHGSSIEDAEGTPSFLVGLDAHVGASIRVGESPWLVMPYIGLGFLYFPYLSYGCYICLGF